MDSTYGAGRAGRPTLRYFEKENDVLKTIGGGLQEKNKRVYSFDKTLSRYSRLQ